MLPATPGVESKFIETVNESSELTAMSSNPNGRSVTLGEALRGLLDGVARTLDVPIALLSRDDVGWRFEAEAFPPRAVDDAPRFQSPSLDVAASPGDEIVDASG